MAERTCFFSSSLVFLQRNVSRMHLSTHPSTWGSWRPQEECPVCLPVAAPLPLVTPRYGAGVLCHCRAGGGGRVGSCSRPRVRQLRGSVSQPILFSATAFISNNRDILASICHVPPQSVQVHLVKKSASSETPTGTIANWERAGLNAPYYI